MRIRQKEIRKNRKRQEEQLKAEIKTIRAAKKAAAVPARSRTRRTTTPSS